VVSVEVSFTSFCLLQVGVNFYLFPVMSSHCWENITLTGENVMQYEYVCEKILLYNVAVTTAGM
jgi:hypothetical protein